jgi:hypothetical protein
LQQCFSIPPNSIVHQRIADDRFDQRLRQSPPVVVLVKQSPHPTCHPTAQPQPKILDFPADFSLHLCYHHPEQREDKRHGGPHSFHHHPTPRPLRAPRLETPHPGPCYKMLRIATTTTLHPTQPHSRSIPT